MFQEYLDVLLKKICLISQYKSMSTYITVLIWIETSLQTDKNHRVLLLILQSLELHRRRNSKDLC